MSYDFYFWREESEADIDVDRLFDELDDAIPFRGIVPIPLAEVKAAFQQEFPDISDCGDSLDWEGEGSYFQVTFTYLDIRTASRVAVCCGYELLKKPEAMERLAKVASSLGCIAFDPQRR